MLPPLPLNLHRRASEPNVLGKLQHRAVELVLQESKLQSHTVQDHVELLVMKGVSRRHLAG